MTDKTSYRELTYTKQTLKTVRLWDSHARRKNVPSLVWARAPIDAAVVEASPHLTWAIIASTAADVASMPSSANVWSGIAPINPRDYEPLIEALRAHPARIRFVYLDELARAHVELNPILDWIVMVDTRAPQDIESRTASCHATEHYRDLADALGKPFFLRATRGTVPAGWRQFPVASAFSERGAWVRPVAEPWTPSNWYPAAFDELFAGEE